MEDEGTQGKSPNRCDQPTGNVYPSWNYSFPKNVNPDVIPDASVYEPQAVAGTENPNGYSFSNPIHAFLSDTNQIHENIGHCEGERGDGGQISPLPVTHQH